MAGATQFGTKLLLGGSLTFTNYEVESIEDGGYEIDDEQVYSGETGAIVTDIQYNRHAVYVFNLICRSAAEPKTDFPEGDNCTLTGYTNYFVREAKVSRTKGPAKVSVRMVNRALAKITT